MNIAKIMKKAQQMQTEVARVQAEVAQLEKTFSVGGGMVEVTAKGDGTISKIRISKEVAKPEEVEGLEDMVLSAVNGALESVTKLREEKMSAVTAGLNIPGLT